MVRAKRREREREQHQGAGETPEELARRLSGDFLRTPTIEEMIRAQGVKPLRSLKDLAVPELKGENIDELLAILREIRGK